MRSTQPLDQSGLVGVGNGGFLGDDLMLIEMKQVLLHGHHSLLGLSFHGRIDLLPIPRSNQVAQSGDVLQNLHGQDTPIAIRSRNQLLTQHKRQTEGQLQAQAFGLLGRKHVHDPAQGSLGVPSMKSGENQMTGFSGAQGQGGGLGVSDFAHENNVRVFP